eukprot:scaffold31364_cov78-Phaeocystis_antarctica.AAC.5
MPVAALSPGQPRSASQPLCLAARPYRARHIRSRDSRQEGVTGADLSRPIPHTYLSHTGIVAISGIDGYASLRVAALGARCDVTPPALHTFKDGTTRSTQARLRREPHPDQPRHTPATRTAQLDSPTPTHARRTHAPRSRVLHAGDHSQPGIRWLREGRPR